jgi:hypothetical protein
MPLLRPLLSMQREWSYIKGNSIHDQEKDHLLLTFFSILLSYLMFVCLDNLFFLGGINYFFLIDFNYKVIFLIEKRIQCFKFNIRWWLVIFF